MALWRTGRLYSQIYPSGGLSVTNGVRQYYPLVQSFFCRIQYGGGKNNFILRIKPWHKDNRCAIDLFVSLFDIKTLKYLSTNNYRMRYDLAAQKGRRKAVRSSKVVAPHRALPRH